MKRQNFTLIELLVVVAITSILMAILLPCLKKAKETVLRIQCTNNLRQISGAVHMYSNDHEEYMPANVRSSNGARIRFNNQWERLGVLVESGYFTKQYPILYCPARTLNKYYNLTVDTMEVTYSYVLPGSSTLLKNQNKVTNLQRKMGCNTACFLQTNASYKYIEEFKEKKDLPHRNQGVNVMYLDSSVKYIVNPGRWGGYPNNHNVCGGNELSNADFWSLAKDYDKYVGEPWFH